ncbi:MAG: hypothetical protein BWY95_01374 [Bacteroidetes bacterium ADurb.BinA104]|nr:MAG: hypothetical protein BWY95_01374 [Bacteroidetes bacterium ADurb.BinA104]
MISRNDILEFAGCLINGSREQSYGHPGESFANSFYYRRIAKMWSIVVGKDLDCTDVVLMLALLKVSRLSNDRTHMDSWVDLAGYAALGGELATMQLSHCSSHKKAMVKEMRNE